MSCAFSAEPRTGASTLPLRRFAPTYCHECGTRLNGDDTCPQCGCVHRSIVQCDECGELVEVDEDASKYSIGHTNDCNVVAYRCSCGAANLSADYGRCECRRCGLRMWRCGGNGRISVGTCECGCYEDDDDDDERALCGND